MPYYNAYQSETSNMSNLSQIVPQYWGIDPAILGGKCMGAPLISYSKLCVKEFWVEETMSKFNCLKYKKRFDRFPYLSLCIMGL